ncbi:hypothetical protein ACWDA3_24190 [Nonomuraea rubra]
MKPESWRNAAIGAGGIALLAWIIFGLSYTPWWQALARNDTGAWDVVDRIADIAAPVSVVVAIIFGVVAMHQNRKMLAQPATGVPAEQAEPVTEAPEQAQRADDPYETLVDQKDVVQKLKDRLLSGIGGVVIVQGVPGVGKTKLVDAVRKDLKQQKGIRRVVWHDALPKEPLKLEVLIRDIEGGSSLRSMAGHPLAHLHMALEEFAADHVVIIIDCAEELLDTSRKNQLVDFDLDEAFEAIVASKDDHHVTLVLVTQVIPASPAGLDWPDSEDPILVEGLPLDFFIGYLTDLDRNNAFKLASLPFGLHTQLRQALRGNLLLAELFHAVLDGGEFSARELIARVSSRQHSQVQQFLLGHLKRNLTDPQRSVLRALAAYDVPVDAASVAKLFDQQRTETVNNTLPVLFRRHLVRRIDDDKRYYLPRSIADDWVPSASDPAYEEWTTLLRGAARELGHMQPQLNGVDDMPLYHAEIRALMRLQWFDEAHEKIEQLDEIVREWNGGYLLLDHRKDLQELITDPFEKMKNYNALGDLYASDGDFKKADDAYGHALRMSTALKNDTTAMKIRANVAEMHWKRNLTNDAFRLFTETLAEAEQHGDQRVRMGALEGLAMCHRRRGDYGQAISHAEMARSVPLLEAYPQSDQARRFGSTRIVNINLRLARWYAERGDRTKARQQLEMVDEARQPWLEASRLDGWADFYLYSHIEKAIETANKAVAAAMQTRDPVTLLQARTTLCVAYLKKGDLDTAKREIDRAERYRPPGRSLIVLALRALIARAKTDFGSAEKLFGALHDYATVRLDGGQHPPSTGDPEDFTAWDLKGFALCGLRLDDDRSTLDDAVSAFREARRITERTPTPGLVRRWYDLVESLDRYRPGRLRPVLSTLDEFVA